MKKPLISIITPVYNAEKYLDECIQSVVNQTYKNIELILINDGSKDRSLEICNKWANIDNRVVVIDKPNGGVATARNKGLEIAKGQLIGFVDNDDTIVPNMYETMYQDMIDNDADIVMCNSCAYINGMRQDEGYKGYTSFEIGSEQLVKRMLTYEKIFCSSVWSKLYRRELIGNVRFLEDITLGDDYYFNGMIYPRVNKFYYNDRAFYNYRKREGSICRSGIGEHFFDKYKVVERLIPVLSKYEFIDNVDLERFKLSIIHEILYELLRERADNKLLKEWKKIFATQLKKVKSIYKFSNKELIKLFVLNNFSKTYYRITSR